MATTTHPKGNIKDFRAFVRKVFAYEPPPKAPKKPLSPKARHRVSAKKKPQSASPMS